MFDQEISVLNFQFVKSAAPFLGQYSASNEIEIRPSHGADRFRKVVIGERLVPQLWTIGMLVAFGLYLGFILVFHFEKIKGGGFGVSVIVLGSIVGLGFGTKAILRLFRSPVVEFDLVERKIFFVSQSRYRRKIAKEISFQSVGTLVLRASRTSLQEDSTEVFILELHMTDVYSSAENIAIGVSGDRAKLEEVQRIISAQTGIAIS